MYTVYAYTYYVYIYIYIYICAEDEAAVHRELHVRGAAGLRAGSGDVLRDVGGGDDDLRQRDVVVGQERDLQMLTDIGVAVDDLRDVVDELDDRLGAEVAGGGL